MRRVLVIDDSALIRAVARASLEGAGYEVVLAESGRQGLELAASEAPDAILLDVVMPGLDGPAVLSRLRQSPATAAIPVVLVTGSEEERASFEELGAAGAIAKPFQAEELHGALREILGWAG